MVIDVGHITPVEMNPRRGFAFSPFSFLSLFSRFSRGRLDATRCEGRKQGREVVHHKRLARIGRFERLQEADCRESWLAFDEARGVGEVAQRGGFTAGAFKRGLAFLLRLEYFAERLAQFARQHHVAHLDGVKLYADGFRVCRYDLAELRADGDTLREQRFHRHARDDGAHGCLRCAVNVRRVIIRACTLFAASMICVVSTTLSFTPTLSALSTS